MHSVLIFVLKTNVAEILTQNMTKILTPKRLEIDGEPYLRAPTLYDPGSDGAAHTQALEDGVDLYTLKSRVISVQTVSGTESKDFTRRKLTIKPKQGYIRNYDSIKVNTIEQEEGMVKRYIETIAELFKMNKEQKRFFLAKANPKPVQIQVLLGVCAQESLLSTVRAEREPSNIL